MDFIPAQYYNLVYTIIVMLFAIVVCWKYQNVSLSRKKIIYSRLTQGHALLFTVLIILFIGFRPNSIFFADGPGYWNAMYDNRWDDWSLSEVNYQFVTKYVMSSMASWGFSGRQCFIVLSTILYGLAYIAMRKLFPNDTLLAMILFCGTFGTFGGAVNGIKNGCACAAFLCAIAYKNDKWWKWLIFLALSFGFHHSLQLSIVAFAICLFCKKTNIYLLFWFFSLCIAVAHITYFQYLLSGVTDDAGAGYLIAGTEGYYTGFRLDFILYSIAPIILGYWVIYKKKIVDFFYQFVYNVYLVMNAIWLLCMYASYTNRIAALSWSLFPILLLYPVVKFDLGGNKGRIIKWVVYGQLSFTLLMSIIELYRF